MNGRVSWRLASNRESDVIGDDNRHDSLARFKTPLPRTTYSGLSAVLGSRSGGSSGGCGDGFCEHLPLIITFCVQAPEWRCATYVLANRAYTNPYTRRGRFSWSFDSLSAASAAKDSLSRSATLARRARQLSTRPGCVRTQRACITLKSETVTSSSMSPFLMAACTATALSASFAAHP